MEQSPLQPAPVGAFRFNTDSSKLEYYDGNQWVNISSTSPEAETGGTRVCLAGGYDHNDSDYTNVIEYANIDSTGNFVNFGDRQVKSGNGIFTYASRTRGVVGCGYDTGPNTSTNHMDYITFASTGNAIDFGDAAYLVEGAGGFSNGVRGVHAYGFQRTNWASKNNIQITTIASKGDAVDTGIVLTTEHRSCGTCASPTRGFWYGGNAPTTNVINYVTISNLSQASDFGDLATGGVNSEGSTGCSNAVRALYFGGHDNPSTYVNVIEYFTMATLGNALDFGDTSYSKAYKTAAASPTRGVVGGGSPSGVTTVEYVQIMSTGNANDFGDLLTPQHGKGGLSNGHGGLG